MNIYAIKLQRDSVDDPTISHGEEMVIVAPSMTAAWEQCAAPLDAEEGVSVTILRELAPCCMILPQSEDSK